MKRKGLFYLILFIFLFFPCSRTTVATPLRFPFAMESSTLLFATFSPARRLPMTMPRQKPSLIVSQSAIAVPCVAEEPSRVRTGRFLSSSTSIPRTVGQRTLCAKCSTGLLRHECVCLCCFVGTKELKHLDASRKKSFKKIHLTVQIINFFLLLFFRSQR